MKQVVRALAAGVALGLVGAAAGSAAPVETAMATADFIDTLGVNVHFSYSKPYRNNAPAVVKLIGDSGIRHLRDGALSYPDKTYISMLDMLAARGEHIDLVTDDRQKLDFTIGQIALLPAGMVDAYEDPNEVDLFRGGDIYVGALRKFAPELYHAVKSDPRTRGLPVIGPSLTTEHAYGDVGDLSAFIDYGNLHNYVQGREPGTDGWGGSHYGSISEFMKAAKNMAGDKPIMTTEAGWGTSTKAGEVTEAVQLKYLQRFFFEQALHGIKRSYIYEFLDEGSSYNTYGLVRGDLTPKPAYTGLRNLIGLFADSGTPRRDEIPVSVDGPPRVAHMLFEKSDGRRFLAVWNEVPSIALRAGDAERETHVAPQTAQIAVDATRADVLTFDASGAVAHSSLVANGGTFTLPVTDSITILAWQPGEK